MSNRQRTEWIRPPSFITNRYRPYRVFLFLTLTRFGLSSNYCSAWVFFSGVKWRRNHVQYSVGPWSLWTDHSTFTQMFWCKKPMHHFGSCFCRNAVRSVYSIFNIMHPFEVPLLSDFPPGAFIVNHLLLSCCDLLINMTYAKFRNYSQTWQ